MSLITETQIEWDEIGGHTHDGVVGGAPIPDKFQVVDIDEGKKVKYYGFQHDSGDWHIAKLDEVNDTVRYSKDVDNPSLTYSQAWDVRTTLTYSLWI